MSDHSKYLAELAWAAHDDGRILSDIQNLDAVLQKNEDARFEAWVDSISDPWEDGDDD